MPFDPLNVVCAGASNWWVNEAALAPALTSFSGFSKMSLCGGERGGDVKPLALSTVNTAKGEYGYVAIFAKLST